MYCGRMYLKNKNILSTSAMLLPILCGAISQQAAAQGTDSSDNAMASEIVVTAQRRAEKSIDVPITITTISATQIAKANVSELADISKLTPGLRFDTSGSFVQPTIRGIGTAVVSSGSGPNVGIYVDGFYIANPESGAFDLMRVSSIQVLKGPQGTLFGRNTTGGAVLLSTSEPSETPGAEFKASYGSFNAVKAQGYATFGITQGLAIDIEGLYKKGDGYFENTVNQDDKVGQYENWSIRTALKAEINEVSLLLRYTHSDTNDPSSMMFNSYLDKTGASKMLERFVSPAGLGMYQAYFGVSGSKGLPLQSLYAAPSSYVTKPGKVAQDPNFPVIFTNKSDIFQGTIKADLGFADLTSYTQYRKDRAYNFYNLDPTTNNYFNIYIGIENKLFTQELLLTSKPGSKLQWTTGLYYFANRDTYHVGGPFGGATYIPRAPYNVYGGSETLSKSIAGYADGTYEITPSLYLTAGLRYGHDWIPDALMYAPNPFASSVAAQSIYRPGPYTTDRVTPRAVLRFKPDDQSSVYASYTGGYKAGLLNVGCGCNERLPVKPESIDAFEIGYKYDNRQISFDASAFYYNYRNLQVSIFQNGLAQILNAAAAHIYGIEGALRYRVSDAFDFNFGATYTHARYAKFKADETLPGAPYYTYCDPSGQGPAACNSAAFLFPGGITNNFGDATGERLQRSPDITATFGAAYNTQLAKGSLTLSGNVYYTSKVSFSPTEQFFQKGYATLSARAQWVDPSERYSLAVFGNNLTNQRYISAVSYQNLGMGSLWSPPATWGVELGSKF